MYFLFLQVRFIKCIMHIDLFTAAVLLCLTTAIYY